MTERIGRVVPERSALRVPRMTVEGERRRLVDSRLEAQQREALPRGLLLDAHQDRAPQFLPAGLGMHEHAFHFAVAGRIDAQRAAAEGLAFAPSDEEADVRRTQRVDIEDVVAFWGIERLEKGIERGEEPHNVLVARALERDGGPRFASQGYYDGSSSRSGIPRHAIARDFPFHPGVRSVLFLSCRRRGPIVDRGQRPQLRDRNRDAGRFPPRVYVGIGRRSFRYGRARPRPGECEALRRCGGTGAGAAVGQAKNGIRSEGEAGPRHPYRRGREQAANACARISPPRSLLRPVQTRLSGTPGAARRAQRRVETAQRLAAPAALRRYGAGQRAARRARARAHERTLSRRATRLALRRT